VMRQTGDDRHGFRLRALIVVLWRGGLRVQEALALGERDLDPRAGRWPCATARAGGGARSAWTPRAGSNCSPGLSPALNCRSARCSASSTARPRRPCSSAGVRVELRRLAALERPLPIRPAVHGRLGSDRRSGHGHQPGDRRRRTPASRATASPLPSRRHGGRAQRRRERSVPEGAHRGRREMTIARGRLSARARSCCRRGCERLASASPDGWNGRAPSVAPTA
jgi:integrase